MKDEPLLTPETVQHGCYYDAFKVHTATGGSEDPAPRRLTFWDSDTMPDPHEGWPCLRKIEGPAAAHFCGQASVVVPLLGHPRYGEAKVGLQRGAYDRYTLTQLHTAIESALVDMEHIQYVPAKQKKKR